MRAPDTARDLDGDRYSFRIESRILTRVVINLKHIESQFFEDAKEIMLDRVLEALWNVTI